MTIRTPVIKTIYIPKQKLTVREFNEIRNNFSSADFSRYATMELAMPMTAAALWYTKKVLRRYKFI